MSGPRRRTVVATGLAGLGAAALAGAGARLAAADTPGDLGGADSSRGHRLRAMDFPAPTEVRETPLLIAGGGVAGLAAAWTLAEAGQEDFTLLELEDQTGGNARSGRNAVSAYPLGAHYLPIPNREASGVRRLLERIGVITGWEQDRPVFDPYQVVSDPDERLLRQGRWQEGLVPASGLTAQDRSDLDRFFSAMAAFRSRKGADGRPAFALPMELSSRDPDLVALDRLSFSDWLTAQGWRSPVLLAHLRYCCRDDYGCEPDQVSAWAGVHYFAGRRGEAANVEGDAVLTWPEGNGRLASAMAARAGARILTGHIVCAAAARDGRAEVEAFDVARNRTVRWRAKAAVLALPRFVLARIQPGVLAESFSYAPWVVANVTVSRQPGGRGALVAWDNVSWTSESLGYVVATHQGLDQAPRDTVLTWYMPLSRLEPTEARRLMQQRTLAQWQDVVRKDLLEMNPDLKGAIRRIDVWRWGHAMVRPTPDFIWGAARQAACDPTPPLFHAHSDMSGLSVFEEAFYRGEQAAEAAMAHVRRTGAGAQA